jgi:hypothetical protein
MDALNESDQEQAAGAAAGQTNAHVMMLAGARAAGRRIARRQCYVEASRGSGRGMATQEREARVESAALAMCREARTTMTCGFFHVVPLDMQVWWAQWIRDG